MLMYIYHFPLWKTLTFFGKGKEIGSSQCILMLSPSAKVMFIHTHTHNVCIHMCIYINDVHVSGHSYMHITSRQRTCILYWSL